MKVYAVTSSTKYNTAGSPVSQTTPWDGTSTRTVKISYTDNFNSTVSGSTYAYPTTITDPAGNSSTVKYRYDMGTNVEATSPAPAGQTYGKTSKRVFDSIGRLDKESVYVNTTEKAYTRYEYFDIGTKVKSFTPIVDVDGDSNIAEDEVMTESWTDGAGRVRRTRTEHPGSTGGWTATETAYDILGRVSAQSVPTEVSVSGTTWTAAGDDSSRGFVYNYTYYDWKGRTTRTVPSDSNGSDGKDTLISYEGCGCAGGQVTTIQGPSVARDDAPTSNARRVQKTYADILGRTYKSENYAWNGTTVYSTNVLTFNGRDQVIVSREYAGTTSSSIYQDTTSSYDGFGRLSSSHKPQERDTSNNNQYWTYLYNPDGSVSTATDPRNAVTSITYNSRGLTTAVSYTPPSGTAVPDTGDIAFTYDNLGHRTQMTDGSGTHSYSYDSLSRLTSETQTFTGLTGNFTTSYDYQLSGKLKSVTDAFGADVYYNDDKAGRTTSITGSDFLDVTTYASNIKYRAFGGVKEMTMGSADSSHVVYGYDNALRISTYEANSSVISGGYIRKATYDYFADGRTKKVSNVLDSGFDQSYAFDSSGRMTSSTSGTKTDSQSETVHPFSQSVVYDAFDNITNRSTEVWSGGDSFGAEYTNHRKTGSGVNEVYDNLGNVVDKTTTSNIYDRWKYDASGKNVETTMRWYQGAPQQTSFDKTETIAQVFDGDGMSTKRTDTKVSTQIYPSSTTTTVKTEYYIRSAALGDKILTELKDDGTKKVTRVFTGEGTLAEQQVINSTTSEVFWRHEDIVTGSYRQVDRTGVESGTADSPATIEYEPLGGAVPQSDPVISDDLAVPSSLRQFKFAGDVNRPEFGCELDSSPVPCNVLHEYVRGHEHDFKFGVRFQGDEHGAWGLRTALNAWQKHDVYKDDTGDDTTEDKNGNIRVSGATRLQYSYWDLLSSPLSIGVGNDDFSIMVNACANSISSYLVAYAVQDGSGLIEPFADVENILNFAVANTYNANQFAFSIANAIQETYWFRQIIEPISDLCIGYSGGCAYRGRGYTHLTHDDGYQSVGEAIGYGDALLNDPDLVLTDKLPVLTMDGFFRTHGVLDILANSNDFLSARKKINPHEKLSKKIKGARISRSLGDRLQRISSVVADLVRGCNLGL